jgi:hypothetical protein
MVQRALVVEDEPLIAIDLEAIDVCGSASNPGGSCRACNKPPARFYLDGRLSRRGPPGINAAKWLREACGIPVLFITGHSDWETVARIHDLLPGAPLCPKPVCPDRQMKLRHEGCQHELVLPIARVEKFPAAPIQFVTFCTVTVCKVASRGAFLLARVAA